MGRRHCGLRPRPRRRRLPALELEAKRLAAEIPAVALAVEVGQELSHYKILSRIGAGGMGEVFLAQDKILERQVALKLLPMQFTQNAERLQRFIRLWPDVSSDNQTFHKEN